MNEHISRQKHFQPKDGRWKHVMWVQRSRNGNRNDDGEHMNGWDRARNPKCIDIKSQRNDQWSASRSRMNFIRYICNKMIELKKEVVEWEVHRASHTLHVHTHTRTQARIVETHKNTHTRHTHSGIVSGHDTPLIRTQNTWIKIPPTNWSKQKSTKQQWKIYCPRLLHFYWTRISRSHTHLNTICVLVCVCTPQATRLRALCISKLCKRYMYDSLMSLVSIFVASVCIHAPRIECAPKSILHSVFSLSISYRFEINKSNVFLNTLPPYKNTKRNSLSYFFGGIHSFFTFNRIFFSCASCYIFHIYLYFFFIFFRILCETHWDNMSIYR